MTVNQLIHTISERELAEWSIFDNIETWKEHFSRKGMSNEERDNAIMNLILGASNG